MATTLTVVRATPYSVQLKLDSTDGTVAYLKKYGATGDAEKDLTSLHAGPLKTFLATRVAWIFEPVIARLQFRRGYAIAVGGGDAFAVPVLHDSAVDIVIYPQGTGAPDSIPAFAFAPVGPTSGALIELRLAHSSHR